jgi:hypothetical protein
MLLQCSKGKNADPRATMRPKHLPRRFPTPNQKRQLLHSSTRMVQFLLPKKLPNPIPHTKQPTSNNREATPIMSLYKHIAYTKKCLACHKNYQTTNNHQRYCSHKCAGPAIQKSKLEKLPIQKAWGIIPLQLQTAWGNSQ